VQYYSKEAKGALSHINNIKEWDMKM